MKRFFVVMTMLVCFGNHAVAHEGHAHDAPKAVQAPKGGLIKVMEKSAVEVVSKGQDLKIYVYDKALKPQLVKDIAVTAQAEHPRTKKIESVALQAKDTHYEGTYDAKGAHRYTLILNVKDSKADHGDKLSFTIEPKK